MPRDKLLQIASTVIFAIRCKSSRLGHSLHCEWRKASKEMLSCQLLQLPRFFIRRCSEMSTCVTSRAASGAGAGA